MTEWAMHWAISGRGSSLFVLVCLVSTYSFKLKDNLVETSCDLGTRSVEFRLRSSQRENW